MSISALLREELQMALSDLYKHTLTQLSLFAQVEPERSEREDVLEAHRRFLFFTMPRETERQTIERRPQLLSKCVPVTIATYQRPMRMNELCCSASFPCSPRFVTRPQMHPSSCDHIFL
jgi:hypothetical protein